MRPRVLKPGSARSSRRPSNAMIVSMPFMRSIRCGDGSSNGLTAPLPPKKKPAISCRRSPSATVNDGGANATKSDERTATARRLSPGSDRFEAALQEVQEALECVDLTDGHLRSAEEVKARVEHAADTLQSLDPACHKVARYSRAIAPLDYRWQRES